MFVSTLAPTQLLFSSWISIRVPRGAERSSSPSPSRVTSHGDAAWLGNARARRAGRLWHATFDDDVRYQTCANKECTLICRCR